MTRTPLVSIAIPAYSPRYLEEALDSAFSQTYANLEIVVTDDCRTDSVQQLVERVAARTAIPIRYFHNETQLMGLHNLHRCLQIAQGQYIKFLNDDDILLPHCVERMVQVLEQNSDIALVTSWRRVIDEQGLPLPDILETMHVFDNDVRLHGSDLISLLAEWPVNFIGEPSTVMFRRAQLIDCQPNPCALGGVTIRAINDLVMYVNLLRQGHLAFLHEPLSYFRRHHNQRQNRPDMQALFDTGRAVFVEKIHELGLYHPQAEHCVRCAPLVNPDQFELFDLRAIYKAAGSAALIKKIRPGSSFALDAFDALQDVLVDSKPLFREGQPPTGIVIHAFYPEILQAILDYIVKLKEPIHLYVTCPEGKEKSIQTLLEQSNLSFSLFRVDNRGRDVLPFLKVLPYLQRDGIKVLLKLHTKKSTHLQIGNQWAAELFEDLLASENFTKAVEQLNDPQNYPLIGSQGYRLPIAAQMSESNLKHLTDLAGLAQIDVASILQTEFFAGTMFFARIDALIPIQKLGLGNDDFEVEQGQLDGTLAHALERFICALIEVKNPFQGGELYRHLLKSRQLASAERELIPQRIASWKMRPNLLVVLSDVATDAHGTRRSLASLAGQLYPPAAVIVISNSPPIEVQPSLNHLWLKPANSWASQINEVISQVEAEWFYLMRSGDELDPHAFLLLGDHIDQRANVCCYYSDEDSLVGELIEGPVFKPDMNLDLLRSFPYIGRNLAFQRSAFIDADGFDPAFGELAPHDLIFRLIETVGLPAIGHIAEALVHQTQNLSQWLVEPEVIAYSAPLVSAHLSRLNIAHEMQPGPLVMMNRVIYTRTSEPLVSIVIPTKDQLPMLMRCIESVMEKTRYPHYEILIVDNASETPEAREWFTGMERLNSEQVRILRYPHPFNYSAINNFAITQARGEYVVLLNNDTAVLDQHWLDALLNHALRPEVGIVGAKLHFLTGGIQHGGVVLGLRGVADHPFLGEASDSNGYLHRLQVDQNYSAVTAACLMIRKSVYLEVGGMDEVDLTVSYNDVDLCLKVGVAGYLVVWTPYAQLMHEANVSQNNVDKTKLEAKIKRFKGEQHAMYQRWLPTLLYDPAYNKNLSLEGSGFTNDYHTEGNWQPFAQRHLPYVLCHAADVYGCGHYRVRQPFAGMERARLVEGAVSDRLFDIVELNRLAPDSVIFQRQLTEPQISIIEDTKAFSKAFKVYELDDYIVDLPFKSMHRGSMPKDLTKMLRKGVGLCDRFVVSTAVLAEAFKDLHRDIQVVPNRLPLTWWEYVASQRRQGRKPRVGWAGGGSHVGDLEMIADVIRDLADEVEWVFMGLCPDSIRPYVYEFHPGISIAGYAKKLASLNLDLAIAPLEDNFFNECKSNLRLLEYGACGFPVVCSDNVCFRDGLPVTRVKNRYRDWVNAIRQHLSDLEATAQAGDELRVAVNRDWMLTEGELSKWSQAWLAN